MSFECRKCCGVVFSVVIKGIVRDETEMRGGGTGGDSGGGGGDGGGGGGKDGAKAKGKPRLQLISLSLSL